MDQGLQARALDVGAGAAASDVDPAATPAAPVTAPGRRGYLRQVQQRARGALPPVQLQTSPDPEAQRRMGVDPAHKSGPDDLGASTIVDRLGPGRFATSVAVNVPDAKVVWVNYELAAQFGFDVPETDRMLGSFHEQLVRNLAYRIKGPDEEVGDRATTEVYADRYADGVHPGAGRASFLPWLNANIKGVGRTPLVQSGKSYDHSHGGAALREGLLEAVWGEVSSNLFSQGGTRILAVIDVNEYTQWEGSKEPRALIVRAGDQLRAAHFAEWKGGGDWSLPTFTRIAQAEGLYVPRKGRGGEVTDVAATMRNYIDRQARLTAEQYRFRVLHGSPTASNMAASGAALDFGTMTSLPGTAPVKVLPQMSAFGDEQRGRAASLGLMYRNLVESIPAPQRAQHNAVALDVIQEMEKAYQGHLSQQLVESVGLKPEAATDLIAAHGPVVREFLDVFKALGAVTNPGSLSVDKETSEGASAVDLYGALAEMPAVYFADPGADLAAPMAARLRPLLRGTPEEQAKVQAQLDGLMPRFARAYKRLMDAVRGSAGKHYDGDASMQYAITERARFENQPLDQLFRARINQVFIAAIDEYKRSGSTEVFRDAVDRTAAASVRSVEGLLRQGGAPTRLDAEDAAAGVELQQRRLDGVEYSVIAKAGGERYVRAALPVRSEGEELLLYGVPWQPRIHPSEVGSLSFHFTTGDWLKDTRDVFAQQEGGRLIFDIPAVPGQIGRLEGVFHLASRGDYYIKDGMSNFRGYTFAIPDDVDLAKLERTAKAPKAR